MLDREALEKAAAEVEGLDRRYDSSESIAEDCITTYLDAMRSKGYAVLPREPTLTMLVAVESKAENEFISYADGYKIMFDAAQGEKT